MLHTRRFSLLLLLFITALLLPLAAGHGGHGHPQPEQDQSALADCRDSPGCRTVTGLIGYDWFDTGAWGMGLGVAFWALVLFGAVRLVQQRLNV